MDERTALSVSRVIASPEIFLELRTARSAVRLERCPDWNWGASSLYCRRLCDMGRRPV